MNMEQNAQDAVRQTQIYSPLGEKEYTYLTNTNRIQGIHKCTRTYIRAHVHTHTYTLYLEASISAREEGGRCDV